MKNDERSFDDVQKALALKRHEQPPPPFFNRFSDEVIDRLHAPRPPERLNWCQRLGLGEDPKPVLLCVLGLVVCGALVVGLIAALRVEKPPETLATQAGDPSQSVNPAAQDQSGASALPGFEPLAPQDGQSGLTMPVLAPMRDTPGVSPSSSEAEGPGDAPRAASTE